MKLVSGVFTTFTSAHSGPPLHASCSGLLCCPLVSQNPQFGAETRAALSKARPNTLEKKHSMGARGEENLGAGPQKVEQHISLLPLSPPSYQVSLNLPPTLHALLPSHHSLNPSWWNTFTSAEKVSLFGNCTSEERSN